MNPKGLIAWRSSCSLHLSLSTQLTRSARKAGIMATIVHSNRGFNMYPRMHWEVLSPANGGKEGGGKIPVCPQEREGVRQRKRLRRELVLGYKEAGRAKRFEDWLWP